MTIIAQTPNTTPYVAPTFLEQLSETFRGMFVSIIESLPNVCIGLAILVIGYIVASIIRKVVVKTLNGIKFNDLLDRAGFGAVFTKIGVKGGANELVGKLIFWIIMLFIIKNAADKVGIEDISNIIDQLIAFFPKVFIATIVMLVGFMVADLIKNAVFTALDNLGLDYAKALSGIIFGFVFVMVLTVALSQLGIETELLKDSVKIILLSLGLGLAICLGLGLKGLASQIVAGVYARDIYKVGTTVEHDGEEAKVAGVGPVTTKLIRLDGGFIMIPNDQLVNKAVKGISAE